MRALAIFAEDHKLLQDVSRITPVTFQKLKIINKRAMYSSISTTYVAVRVVLIVLASVFVALRLTVRASTKAGVGADDYLILLALVCIPATSVFGPDWDIRHRSYSTEHAARPSIALLQVVSGTQLKRKVLVGGVFLLGIL